MRYKLDLLSTTTLGALALYVGLFWIDQERFAFQAYVVSIALALTYLRVNLQHLFTATSLFIVIVVVAHSFPVLPYTVFDVPAVTNFERSLHVNSIGLLLALSIANLNRAPRAKKNIHLQVFNSVPWQRFHDANMRIFVLTVPIVLGAMILSGGWRAVLGMVDPDEFSRTGNFKGLGPLMLGASINVFSGALVAYLNIAKGRWLRGLALLVLMLTINSFTLGRGNVILVFLFGAFFYATVRGVNIRLLLTGLLLGIGIVLLQLTRYSGDAEANYTGIIAFFLRFSADFDSINNTAHLITHTQDEGFPGLYHIYSFLYNPIPRWIFTDKPHFIGILHLNDLIFPGMYRGEEGGSNFTFGIFGTWYAVNGLPVMLAGITTSMLFLVALDRRILRWQQDPKPTFFLILYLFVLGQMVIFYRDGISMFISAAIQMPLYQLLYLATSSSSKPHTRPARGSSYTKHEQQGHFHDQKQPS